MRLEKLQICGHIIIHFCVCVPFMYYIDTVTGHTPPFQKINGAPNCMVTSLSKGEMHQQNQPTFCHGTTGHCLIKMPVLFFAKLLFLWTLMETCKLYKDSRDVGLQIPCKILQICAGYKQSFYNWHFILGLRNDLLTSQFYYYLFRLA